MNSKQVFLTIIIAVLLLFIFDNISFPKTGENSWSFSKNSDLKSFSKLQIEKNKIFVEFVSTEAERELGLSGRDSLKEDSGMFFVFDRPDFYGIWMKDMKFPIDIIWLDENLHVTSVVKEVFPQTFPKIFYPDKKSSYVIEVNTGFVEKSEIKIGDVVNFLKN